MTVDGETRRRALALLGAARVGHFATATPDGRPHVVPLCFVVIADAVYSIVDDKPKATRTGLRRLRNLEANPRASLVVDHYEEEWKALWFVMVEGAATMVHDASEYRVALAALRGKYPQYRAMELADATHPMIRIRIDRVVTWQGDSLR